MQNASKSGPAPPAPDAVAVQDEQNVNEEYKAWKKNSPFLYEVLVTHALDWPTLTLQWFPEQQVQDQDVLQRLLIGTHTSGAEQNYLQVLRTRVPEALASPNKSTLDTASYPAPKSRIEIIAKLPHDGEVNRARYMPQKTDIVATKAVTGEVHLYRVPNADGGQVVGSNGGPERTLKGHTIEGYGLAWNPNKDGELVSASEDTTICMWDIHGVDAAGMPTRVFSGHKSVVGDVSWHSKDPTCFGSVGDDHMLFVWDTRDGRKAMIKTEAHDAEVNSLAFNPGLEWLVATGSVDTTVALWDIRNTKRKIHTLSAHTNHVLQVSWSPTNHTVLASASADRRVMIWDLNDIGEEVDPEFLEDGPPELLFTHAGHTNSLSDVSWNPHHPWILATAAEDNMVQVWSPSADIYCSEVDVGDEELESRKRVRKE